MFDCIMIGVHKQNASFNKLDISFLYQYFTDNFVLKPYLKKLIIFKQKTKTKN